MIAGNASKTSRTAPPRQNPRQHREQHGTNQKATKSESLPSTQAPGCPNSNDCANCRGCRTHSAEEFRTVLSTPFSETLTMGISYKTGRHLSWLACLLLVCFGPDAKSASADELSNSVTSELLNLSRAFRSLDQSFQYRGMSSRLASTAGSAFVDWEAKGIPVEQAPNVRVPDPVLVGCAAERLNAHHGEHCGGSPQPEEDPCCACERSGCGGREEVGHHHFQLHGHSQGGCAATIGIPLHPLRNDCRATIGIPLHPVAACEANSHQHGCSNYDRCDECSHNAAAITPPCSTNLPRCESCYVVEQYRNGVLTRTKVPCESCQAQSSHQ